MGGGMMDGGGNMMGPGGNMGPPGNNMVSKGIPFSIFLQTIFLDPNSYTIGIFTLFLRLFFYKEFLLV